MNEQLQNISAAKVQGILHGPLFCFVYHLIRYVHHGLKP